MQQAEKILSEMGNLLDRIIESARKLLALSKQVIEEDELMRLQQEQEELLSSLIDKDAQFQKTSSAAREKLMPARLKIDGKIDEFQKLNSEFVENINTAHGLIQFGNDVPKIKK
ncbi:MAG TPA: hypothetical protein VGP47_07630 [Parachlamydiaceae bacterium]|nr:hypothetical protein [Parachlamydiaceae bacterium]